jgi:hypothetical protein
LRKKLLRDAKRARLEEKETDDTSKDEPEPEPEHQLSHDEDERVDIFYDPNKVSKGDIFIRMRCILGFYI